VLDRVDLGRRIDRALGRIHSRTGVSLAFAGLVSNKGAVSLERFAGPTLGALPGVTLDRAEGLGGKAADTGRAMSVVDYARSGDITHRYDKIIRAERLRSMAAVPIVVGRTPVAVVYGAYRNGEVASGRVMDIIAQEARSLEQELVLCTTAGLSDTAYERDRSVAQLAELQDRVRDAHAQLRSMIGSVEQEAIRIRLADTIRRLEPATLDSRDRVPRAVLTPREVDTLSLVGQGLSNAQIATLLGLTVGTIKSYMKTTMSKLDATTRLEAVVLARRARLLP